jgi:hypothetical protein
LCTFSLDLVSVASNGLVQFVYPSSAINDDDQRKKDAIQKCSEFPEQSYVDSKEHNGDKEDLAGRRMPQAKGRFDEGRRQRQDQQSRNIDKTRKLVTDATV